MAESWKHKASDGLNEEHQRQKVAKSRDDLQARNSYWDRIAQDVENMYAGRLYQDTVAQDVEHTRMGTEGRSDSAYL